MSYPRLHIVVCVSRAEDGAIAVEKNELGPKTPSSEVRGGESLSDAVERLLAPMLLTPLRFSPLLLTHDDECAWVVFRVESWSGKIELRKYEWATPERWPEDYRRWVAIAEAESGP